MRHFTISELRDHWRVAVDRSLRMLRMTREELATASDQEYVRVARACIVRVLLGMEIDGKRPTIRDVQMVMGFAPGSRNYHKVLELSLWADDQAKRGNHDVLRMVEDIQAAIKQVEPVRGHTAETWKRLKATS